MPSAWRELAARVGVGGGCGANAAFATFVSGDKYVPGAVCLRRSLLAAGSVCPMEVIIDDRSAQHNLSATAWQTLASVYGHEHMFSLANIMAQHPMSADDMEYSAPHGRPSRSRGQQHRVPRGAAAMASLPPAGAAANGRRLFERGVEHMATHAKLWLFGVPRARLIVLDADMVALGPLDWLTTLPLAPGQVAAMGFRYSKGATTPSASSSSAAAVPAAGTTAATPASASPRYFNSGLMILQPTVKDLRDLTRLAFLARQGNVTIAKAGEKFFGDQSLLNWHFHDRWLVLPPGLIGVAPAKLSVDGARILATDPAVVHWLSEPKPWGVASFGRLDGATRQPARREGMRSQAALWWQLCSAHVDGVPAYMIG